jgi:hypothetical protein
MKLLSYQHIFKELIKTDLLVIKPLILDKLIDLFIWIITIVLVNAYIMPFFGLSTTYGTFMLASLASSAGLFEVFPSVMQFISDLEGDKTINYYITLPVPSWLVLLRSILHYAMNAAIMGILIVPIGKLLLFNQFELASVNILQYVVIFFFTNLFYGCFTLWIISYVKNMLRIGSVWMRFIYPLWFLGCWQFSWQSLYTISPVLAYLDILNPMTFVAEGYRVALLGSQDSLNFWLCVGMLIVFSVGMGWHAMVRLKKRLDFV